MPLTKNQIKTIGECLRAAAYGPFFPDGEFDTIFGLSRSQVASVAAEWPIVIENAEIANAAVGNSINNLLGYPIKVEKLQAWDEFISIDRKDLLEIFQDWKLNK